MAEIQYLSTFDLKYKDNFSNPYPGTSTSPCNVEFVDYCGSSPCPSPKGYGAYLNSYTCDGVTGSGGSTADYCATGEHPNLCDC